MRCQNRNRTSGDTIMVGRADTGLDCRTVQTVPSIMYVLMSSMRRIYQNFYAPHVGRVILLFLTVYCTYILPVQEVKSHKLSKDRRTSWEDLPQVEVPVPVQQPVAVVERRAPVVVGTGLRTEGSVAR